MPLKKKSDPYNNNNKYGYSKFIRIFVIMIIIGIVF